MNRTGAQFNRVSGRKESGAAVTAKVFTLGNSFELSGRDYYERDAHTLQNIKQNRLNANERRRRQAKARTQAERRARKGLAGAGAAAPDRFAYTGKPGHGPGPAPNRTAQNNSVGQPGRGAVRSRYREPRRQPQPAKRRPAGPHRRPTQAPRRDARDDGGDGFDDTDRYGGGDDNATQDGGGRTLRGTVADDEIGVLVQERAAPHFDTRKALDSHKASLAGARRMQRGGVRDVAAAAATDGHQQEGQKDRTTPPRQRTSPKAYTQKTNTRQPDSYLSLLLGKTPVAELPRQEEAPPSSPDSIREAKRLENELSRRRRLLEIEAGIGASAGSGEGSRSPRSARSNRSPPRSRQSSGRRSSPRSNVNRVEAPPFNTEPLARRIERRKQVEKNKMADGNVNRLVRASKSAIVELQLCVWDWQKKPKFKSKDVARTRRVSLRRRLHNLLAGHRRACVELVVAVRQWAAHHGRNGVNTFFWNGHDVLELLRRCPTISGSSTLDAKEDVESGKEDSHACEFGISFLADCDDVVSFLGFAVGEGDAVRRIDGALDCNLFLLTPEDRIRAARLLGRDADADHLAAALLFNMGGGAKDGEGDDDNDNEGMPDDFPYSCAEEMPLVCRLCHAGERDDDGKCPNCGHKGGADWRALDERARRERFVEEREWFEEERADALRRKAEAKAARTAPGKRRLPQDIKYQPKISDRDLLRFAKVQQAVFDHQRDVQGIESPIDKLRRHREEDEARHNEEGAAGEVVSAESKYDEAPPTSAGAAAITVGETEEQALEDEEAALEAQLQRLQELEEKVLLEEAEADRQEAAGASAAAFEAKVDHTLVSPRDEIEQEAEELAVEEPRAEGEGKYNPEGGGVPLSFESKMETEEAEAEERHESKFGDELAGEREGEEAPGVAVASVAEEKADEGKFDGGEEAAPEVAAAETESETEEEDGKEKEDLAPIVIPDRETARAARLAALERRGMA